MSSKKNTKKKKQTTDSTVVLQILNAFYLTCMLLVFPIYFRNAYIDILRAKRDFFYLFTGGYLVLMILFFLCLRLPLPKIKDRLFFLFAGGFGVFSLIGTLLSGHIWDSFYGQTGRYTGTMMVLMGLAAVYFLGIYTVWYNLLTYFMMTGCGIVYLFQVLNHFHVDPLHMYENLNPGQVRLFTSTLGNLNFNSSFDCITVPVFIGLFFLSKNKAGKIRNGLMVFLGFIGGMCCRSESFYVGIIFAFIMLAGFELYSRQNLFQTTQQFGILLGSILVLKLLTVLNPERHFDINGILALLLTPYIILLFAAVFLVLLAIHFVLAKKNLTFPKNIWKLYGIFIGCAFGAGILCMIAANLLPNAPAPLSALVMTDKFGSSRGYIWKRSVVVYFAEFPFKDKLFGCGWNAYSYYLEKTCMEDMIALTGARYIDAHNDFLQLLVTTGFTGITCFIGMFVCLFRSSLRQLPKKESLLPFLLCAVSFIGQGLVNNLQVITLPALFLLLGLWYSALYGREN